MLSRYFFQSKLASAQIQSQTQAFELILGEQKTTLFLKLKQSIRHMILRQPFHGLPFDVTQSPLNLNHLDFAAEGAWTILKLSIDGVFQQIRLCVLVVMIPRSQCEHLNSEEVAGSNPAAVTVLKSFEFLDQLTLIVPIPIHLTYN